MKMANAAVWSSMSEEDRNQTTERLREGEGQMKNTAGLCQETLHMVNLLTSDEIIKKPFLLGQLLPRFTGMILNVIRNLVGPKSLEIKVRIT
jgi:hypothetical protein